MNPQNSNDEIPTADTSIPITCGKNHGSHTLVVDSSWVPTTDFYGFPWDSMSRPQSEFGFLRFRIHPSIRRHRDMYGICMGYVGDMYCPYILPFYLNDISQWIRFFEWWPWRMEIQSFPVQNWSTNGSISMLANRRVNQPITGNRTWQQKVLHFGSLMIIYRYLFSFKSPIYSH